MEIIFFIKDLRKRNILYYQVWMPIILQFDTEEFKRIKLTIPNNIPRTTYYRAISYGLDIFPNYVKKYILKKGYNELVLSNYSEHLVPKKQDEIKEVEYVEVLDVAKPKKKAPAKKQDQKYPDETYEIIISYLNQCTGRDFKPFSATNRNFITQRLNDGYTIEDFKHVIATKSTNWLNTEQEIYLRPETLFCAKHFESYLNENIVKQKTTLTSKLENAYEQVNIASELRNSQG